MRAPEAQPLVALLERHRPELVRFFERQDPAVLRRESAEDLAQGVQLRIVEDPGDFVYQGDDAFRGWLFRVARQHIAARAAYWRSAKRDAGRLLRIAGGGASTFGGLEPAASATGPITFAQRREMMELAIRAVSTLQERDRLIVQLGPDASIEEVAQRTGLSHQAAQRARLRALERFEQSYRILAAPPERDPR